MGAPLINRAQYPVQLTEAGTQFLPVALGAVTQLTEQRQMIRDADRGGRRFLRFSALHTISMNYLALRIDSLQEEMPDLHTRVVSDSLSTCCELLVEGAVDIMLCYYHQSVSPRIDEAAFERKDVMTDWLVPVAASAAVRAHGWDLGDPAAPPIPFLAYEPSTFLGMVVGSALEGKSLNAETIYIDGLVETIKRRVLKGSGFAWVPQTAVAAELEYSKGTIYNHFSSKEDCLAAFCVRGMSQLRGLFQRALTFNGTPREIALAIHFAYRLHLQLNPTVCMALVTARTPSFAEKTSPERSQQMKTIDGELFSMAFKVIDDAIKAGELELREDLPEIVITFLNWSMSYGINMLANTGFDHSVSDYLEERNIALVGANVLMDGLGMTPLSKDWDYARTWQRIADEIFAEDILRINIQK